MRKALIYLRFSIAQLMGFEVKKTSQPIDNASINDTDGRVNLGFLKNVKFA